LNYVLRFAPSPTGYLHVGGARTAIFNWLIARQKNGRFLLRIEDTDRLRSTDESIQTIISSLKWLGLNWDGDILYQSTREQRHLETAYKLLQQGKAYRCFCSKEELEEKRKRAEALKLNQRYDGTCRHLTAEQIRQKLRQGLPFAIRFKVPQGRVHFDDLIHGSTTIENNTLDDFIIVRSDNTPVYQLAVVVDDHDMGVTLVLRGDDHISNTNKQILLYQAMGWPVPQFAHVPLILGTDKKRLSKRHGATSVEEFKNMGIFPEALFNYLCLLGWSPGNDREIFSKEELIREFSLQRINKTPAVFDLQKLLWMNGKYLAQKSVDELLPEIKTWLKTQNLSLAFLQNERFRYLIKLLQVRAKTINELITQLSFFFYDPQQYEEKGVKKFFKKENSLQILTELYTLFAEQPDRFFNNLTEIEQSIRQLAQNMGLSAGKIIHPLRLALTGSTSSPGIFEIIYILGQKKVLNRLKNAINYTKKLI